MMSTNPVLASLKSLLPSTTAIPPHLQSAATSLLSISRQRAANLKPDEEIARTHACAELACKRLRAHLRLPNIKSGNGAPCRPAVYKRLMTFLEGITSDVDLLGTPLKPKDGPPSQKTPTTGGRSTTKKRAIQDLSKEDEDDVNSVETPTKKRKTIQTTPSTTPVIAKAKKINGFLGKIQTSTGKGKGKAKEQEAPDYILPTVRTVCKAFKITKLIPHIYTGVVIGIGLGGLQPDPETQTQPLHQEQQDKLKTQHLCLVLASFAITLTRMHQGDITQETFDTVTERGLTVVGLNDIGGTLKTAVEDWISKVTAWAMDDPAVTSWIDSIPLDALPPFKLPPLSLAGGKVGKADRGAVGAVKVSGKTTVRPRPHANGQLSRREEIAREMEKEDPDDILLPGLGTMVHDGVDYFSAERAEEYAEWKADILQRVEAMETGKGSGRRRVAAVAG